MNVPIERSIASILNLANDSTAWKAAGSGHHKHVPATPARHLHGGGHVKRAGAALAIGVRTHAFRRAVLLSAAAIVGFGGVIVTAVKVVNAWIASPALEMEETAGSELPSRPSTLLRTPEIARTAIAPPHNRTIRSRDDGASPVWTGESLKSSARATSLPNPAAVAVSTSHNRSLPANDAPNRIDGLDAHVGRTPVLAAPAQPATASPPTEAPVTYPAAEVRASIAVPASLLQPTAEVPLALERRRSLSALRALRRQ